ncbi:hypothetical protein KM043_015548 [Ampulex compressa]|nr:hypothetical protein KM043_015548 [Ampulex compressa]
MKSQAGRKARDDENEMSGRRPRWFLPRRWRSPRAASLVGAEGEMKHSFTRALTARKVDFMMIITGERSKSGWPRAFHAGSRRPGLPARGIADLRTAGFPHQMGVVYWFNGFIRVIVQAIPCRGHCVKEVP